MTLKVRVCSSRTYVLYIYLYVLYLVFQISNFGDFKSFNIIENKLLDLERIDSNHFSCHGLTALNGLICLVSKKKVHSALFR